MAPGKQLQLPYVPHTLEGEVVVQRQRDGYINATAMCKAAGKNFADYNRIGPTRAFLAELSSEVGLPIAELIQSLSGGTPALQGTWVHPQVAINLAQWCSAKFAVRVSGWVYDWMSGAAKKAQGRLPYHLRRYIANQSKVPPGHFSVLTEMTYCLVAPMEAAGYELPEKLWPDISQGKMFAKWLRDEFGTNTATMPTYAHAFEDGRPDVQAKAYPNAFLAVFREHFATKWLPERAEAYFTERDPTALPYLPKALAAAQPKQALMPPKKLKPI